MSNLSTNIPIVILAAGASKRMKRPKQLLSWGDSNLIGHAVNTALKVKDSEVFVVLGANFQRIKESISQANITILNNKKWEQGLGRSIAFAVSHIQALDKKPKGVLFMLADQPFIDEHFLNELINEFEYETSSIVATSYNDKDHGVPAIFDKTYFKELSALNKDIGAKLLFDKYRLFIKTLTPETSNIDLDTIKDYQKYSRRT